MSNTRVVVSRTKRRSIKVVLYNLRIKVINLISSVSCVTVLLSWFLSQLLFTWYCMIRKINYISFHFPAFISTTQRRLQRSCLIDNKFCVQIFLSHGGQKITTNVHQDSRSYFGIMSRVYRSLLGYTDINSSEKLNGGQSLRICAVTELQLVWKIKS